MEQADVEDGHRPDVTGDERRELKKRNKRRGTSPDDAVASPH